MFGGTNMLKFGWQLEQAARLRWKQIHLLVLDAQVEKNFSSKPGKLEYLLA